MDRLSERGGGDREMTIVCIHQPQYIPYIGFFNKLAQSDIFVIHDDITAIKRDFTNRNKIRTQQGWKWLTIPVYKKDRTIINEITISNSINWKAQHWMLLQNLYGKCPFFEKYCSFFEDVYNREWQLLIELDIAILKYISKELGLKASFILSSSLGIVSNATDKLVEICKAVDADVYLSGIGGKNYIEEGKFEEANIKLGYQNFHYPVYKQRFEHFEPNMSIVDLLFNCGDESLDIIMSGGNVEL